MANLHSEMRITDTTVISYLKSARSVPQFALPSGAGSIWGKGGATAEPKRFLRTVDHIQGANLEYQFTLLGDPSSSPRPPVPKHSRWTRRLRSSASLSNRWRPFPADALSRPPGGRAGGRTVPLRVHNEVTRNQHGGGSWANGHRRPKGDGALPRAPPPACGGRLAASKTTWRDPASRCALRVRGLSPPPPVLAAQRWPIAGGSAHHPPHAPSGKVAWTARPLQLARKKEEMGTARGVRDTGPIAGLRRAARWGSPGTTY